MKKMKRSIVGIFLVVAIMMHSVMALAAEAGCTHNWVTYSLEKVYEGNRSCTEHEYCIVYEVGYNAIDVCTICGERVQRHFTQATHNYVSR